ncbi:arylamine N-acetyltransferase [Caballeronia sp. TF1N1]|uniref:arylamine N-acetyltransferase family protein n=1 Tax=Caballeronia sp. TF1N1 TaxID=2878153 RepID=UPI001FCF9077|nr:arylamine N-acetyltransferase [Caballeronia sp. TF1N1]
MARVKTAARLEHIDGYLSQLGFRASPEPTLATLRALQERHTRRFPFENLSTLLREPTSIDVASLEQKIVLGGRGGYCYELNLLFLALLRQLGFDARGLTGRVVMGGPETAWAPRTHMSILVTFGPGDDYISDVGFGRMVPTTPLRLDTDAEQTTSLERFRLLQREAGYVLQARINGVWRALYVFDLQRQEQIDFEIGNWFISTHPASPLASQLVVARTDEGRRKSLVDGNYGVHHLDAVAERRQISCTDELLAVLQDEFGIRLPGGDLTNLLGRLIKRV